MNQKFTTYYGIDVSKNWIDVAVNGKVIQLNQNKRDIDIFINQHINEREQSLVVLESTGGYELLAAQCFDNAGVTVHIAHPNKVRNFAKAKGRLAKTDKLDALILAEYGQFIEPSDIRPLRSALTLELAALNNRLAQLKHLHHQESCRLGTANVTGVRQMHEAMLKLAKEQILETEQQIRALISTESTLQAKYERAQTMIGVGPTLALTLVAVLPELGHASKKEIAALAGVAPITKDSGKQKGRAITQNGRGALRRILYMGALSAIRYDKKMRLFYERLVGKGKAKKVAIVAVMRKMLVMLNAMLMNAEDYRMIN